VEIPAPPRVRCEEHGAVARLIQTAGGQVRYEAQPWQRQDASPGEPPSP
jgi:hypothetical protein